MASTTILFDLIGRDGASQAFRSAAASAEAAGARISSVGKKINAVGVSMTRGITLPAAVLGGVAVKMATDFDSAMTRIQTQAGASAKDVKILTAQVLDLAAHSQQGPTQLADALYHLKSVGLDNVDAMKALAQSSHLAAVGNADLEETTNAVAGAWRSGIRGATNFKGAVSTLNAIIGAGNMTMGDLNAAIGTGFLPSARTFGISLKDVGSALALMTDEGIPAAAAATRLRMSFSLLGAPSATAQKVLAGIGVSAAQLGHTLRDKGLVGAIGLLKDHMVGLSKVAKAQLLSNAFGGGRSSSAILTLINNFDVLQKKEKQVQQGASKFGADVAKQAKTPQAQFKLLISTLQVLAVRIGNQLLPAVLSAARGLNSFITWFQTLDPVVKKVTAGFALYLIALGPVLAITGRIVQGIGLLVTAFNFLKDAALLTRIQLAALWVTEKIGAIATKAIAAAQWLLNAALDANPVGLIVVGIAALAAGLVIAYKKSATFRAIVQGALHGVLAAASAVADFFTHKIPAAFNRVVSAASSVLGWVRGHWPLLLAVLAGPFGLAVLAIAKNWDKIRSGVTTVISDVTGFFKALPGKILHALGNVGHLLFSAGVDLMNGLIAGIDSKISAVTGKLADLAGKVASAFKKPLGIFSPSKVFRGYGQNLMDGLLQGIADKQMSVQTAMGKIAALIQNAGSKISNLTSTKSGFMQTFTPDSIFSTDQSSGTVGIAGLVRAQRAQATRAHQLLRDIRKATQMGLSKDLIKQLEAGGTSGAATLHQIALGDPAQIRQLNQLNKQTNASLQAAGLRAGNYVRGGSINADIKLAQKQEHVLELLEHHLKDLAHSEKKGQTIEVQIDSEAVIKAIIRRNKRKGVKTAGV